MTKRLLLAIVCLLVITVTAGAQKRERKMKRIDRGVQERVFIPKGQWMAGGSVSYSEHEEDNLNFLVLKDVEGKGYNFKVSPYFGYFLPTIWRQDSVLPTTVRIWTCPILI